MTTDHQSLSVNMGSVFGVCIAGLLCGISLWFFKSSQDNKKEAARLIRNHLQRGPKWLSQPFAVGFPKPRGKWVYRPSAPMKGNKVDVGRQTWEFISTNNESEVQQPNDFDANSNPNSSDKLYRNQLLAKHKNIDVFKDTKDSDPIANAINYFFKLQNSTEDTKLGGFWGGDYGGPMFLLPGLIISCFITKSSIIKQDYYRYYMIKYILNHQQKDGGWGLHIESHSTMFGTVLQYISLRILGLSKDHAACKLALKFIHKHTVFGVPSWCKFYLCILNIFSYKSMEYPIPTELWLLPNNNIFHPGNLWCHCRMVYLPMSYLYGIKYQCDIDEYPLIKQLRSELLHPYKFESITNNNQWSQLSHYKCSTLDQIIPSPTGATHLLYKLMYYYEWNICPNFKILQYLRNIGNTFAIEYINKADIQTNFINIGPVNKVLHLVSIYVAPLPSKPTKDEVARKLGKVRKHESRLLDYLWVSEDGMKMQGYNGSQLWDTAFGIQAICEYLMIDDYNTGKKMIENNKLLKDHLLLSLEYFRETQIVQESSDEWQSKYFRSKQLGAWPFSTRMHGWPITDCTSEAFKCVLTLQFKLLSNDESGSVVKSCFVPNDRILNAVDMILHWQNKNDGGWSTYERNRGYNLYEQLNPAQVFKNIMIDYSHIECTSACIQSLMYFLKLTDGDDDDATVDTPDMFKNYRRKEILQSIKNGIKFIKKKQFEDGRYIGFWAICCTYAMWFASIALQITHDMKILEIDNSKEISKIESFLLKKQNKNDGGWNESYKSCVSQNFVNINNDEKYESQIVQTSWALLTLLTIKSKEKKHLSQAKDFLLQTQLSNGDWPQQHILGIFNHTCGISYTNYRNIFPIWALAKYKKVYGTL